MPSARETESVFKPRGGEVKLFVRQVPSTDAIAVLRVYGEETGTTLWLELTTEHVMQLGYQLVTLADEVNHLNASTGLPLRHTPIFDRTSERFPGGMEPRRD